MLVRGWLTQKVFYCGLRSNQVLDHQGCVLLQHAACHLPAHQHIQVIIRSLLLPTNRRNHYVRKTSIAKKMSNRDPQSPASNCQSSQFSPSTRKADAPRRGLLSSPNPNPSNNSSSINTNTNSSNSGRQQRSLTIRLTRTGRL